MRLRCPHLHRGFSALPAVLLAVTVVLGALSSGCEGSAAGEASGDPSEVLEVRRGPLVRQVLLTGELVAEDALELTAPDVEIWPLQIRWVVEDGTQVAAGDPVVEFDNSSLASRLEESRNAVLQAESSLASAYAQAAAQVEQAEFDLLQKKAAHDKAVIDARVPRELSAALDYERFQLELKRAELELAQAQRSLAATRAAGEAEVEIQRLSLEKAHGEMREVERGIALLAIEAPKDGLVVLDTNFMEERVWQAGDSVFPGQQIARLPNLDTLVVEARLFDVDDGRVAPGMTATVTLDAYPEQSFGGRLRSIDQVARETSARSARRAFSVQVDLEDVDLERMLPGMSAKVVVSQPLAEDVAQVPRRSLRFLPGGGAEARRAGGDWAPVRLGPCNLEACAVEEGLEVGERLAPAAEAAAPAAGGSP